MVGVDVYKFTGKMGQPQREQVVAEFNDSRRPRVMLISLHAGGVGLSLHHGSSTLFLCEPYYNPYVEAQAAERVHRIGQTEEVNVYRFSMDATVETWIRGLKQKKVQGASVLELADGAGGETRYFDDLGSLFGDLVAARCAKQAKERKDGERQDKPMDPAHGPRKPWKSKKSPMSKKMRKELASQQ